MKLYCHLLFFLCCLLLLAPVANSQVVNQGPISAPFSYSLRVHDSVMAARVPVLTLPANFKYRSLPSSVNNALNDFWPGVQDQFLFYSCQQYASVAYVFGYEMSRARNLPGWHWENSYPTHFTWNFMNQGERYIGVNFLQSFEAIRQQGHMTSPDFGVDSSSSYLGWISGYDKYYRGMSNHLKQVRAIMVNSAEGINTLRNYLYDHLDGSNTGGIACFTTDAVALYNMQTIPAGTPEAGKHIITRWEDNPDHGLTVVGYDDSIRFDLNHDGKYTNDLDINHDGIVDARDWEIGAFRIANSYGSWWEDLGFTYALYSAFAGDYGAGGVWNNRVYVVDPDTAYHPLLTMKATVTYNLRDRIRILAGVSTDTLHRMPDHVLDFPLFNLQGGEHVMQGWDSLPGSDTLEFGLDVTDLLNYVEPGQPARYFLAVEEHDPDHLGHGEVKHTSFISYDNGFHEFPAGNENVTVADNAVTLVSVVAAADKPLVTIVTDSLPPFTAGQPYHAQLAAAGGRPPYDWWVAEDYHKKPATLSFPQVTGISIPTTNGALPYSPVALPFSFPFYGRNYDSIYVNVNGYVTFEPLDLPGIFTTDEVSMLRMIQAVAPAFSLQYTYVPLKGDGIFMQSGPSQVTIRWRATIQGHLAGSTNDFALVLYPDGRFEFRYGDMINQGFQSAVYSGISKGDGMESDIVTTWDAPALSGKSLRFSPPVLPAGIAIDNQGMLSCSQPDSTQIYKLNIRVADAGKITGSKTLMLSQGLGIACSIAGSSGNQLEFGKRAGLTLLLTNTGSQPIQNISLKFRSVDSLLTIHDSLFTVALVQPGKTLTIHSAFSFELKNPADNGLYVSTSLLAQSGARVWKIEDEFRVAASSMAIDKPVLKDGANGILDPGEVADLVVTIENLGILPAQSLALSLVSLDTVVTVLSAPSLSINRVDPMSSLELSFRVGASRHAVEGTQVPMNLRLADSLGTVRALDFILPVSKKQVALVSLSASDGSLLAMAAALDSLHVGYDTIRALPVDYSQYTCVFLILGTATTGFHSLSFAEAADLVNYLQKSGNLYMEGYLAWYYSNTTQLQSYFNYTSAKIPDYTYQQVTGVKNTFADSMAFAYTAPLHHAIFSFVPKTPAYATFSNSDSLAKNFEIACPGNGYRTIGTFLGFDALTGSSYPSTRGNLMKRYLEFFGLNVTGPHPFFHAAATQTCLGKTLDFTDDSYDHITSWSWEFPGGTPAVSTLQNPAVRYDSLGKFDVRLTVSDGANTRSIVKQGYISVERCTSQEAFTARPRFRVYPNPASGSVTIESDPYDRTKFKYVLFDLKGSKLIDNEFNPDSYDSKATLKTGWLKKGFYFLWIQSDQGISTHKLIID
ncbi:MAG: T9SS type A sorting domain-containing protein [Bacteroidota bacterium]